MQVLVQPLRSLRGTRRVWRKILFSWLLALVFAIPQLLIFVQTQEQRSLFGETQDIIVYGCKSAGYTAEWQRKLYFTFMTSYIFIIPTCIMTFCYARITCVIWLRAGTPSSAPRDIDMPRIHFVTSRRSPNAAASSVPGVCRPGRQQTTNDRPLPPPRSPRSALSSPSAAALGLAANTAAVTSKRNVVKMTMSVIAGFVVCWTPYFVVSLIRIYSDYRHFDFKFTSI